MSEREIYIVGTKVGGFKHNDGTDTNIIILIHILLFYCMNKMSSQDRRVMTISNQNNWPLVNYRDAQGRGFPCACRTHYLRQAKNNGSKQQMKPNREHKNTSRQKIQKPHTHKIHSSHELKIKSNSITFQVFYKIQRMHGCTTTVRAECTHMERGSRLLTSDRLLVLCFSLWLSSGSDLYPASMSTKRKHRVNPKHVTWTMEHLSHK